MIGLALLVLLVVIVVVAAYLLWTRLSVADPPPAVEFALCAKESSVTMPDGTVVPIWGYARLPEGVAPDDLSVVPEMPGPVLEVNAGDQVTITLHNTLPEPVSILLPGQDMPPDYGGAPPGGSTTITFIARNPGTYLYESGINPQKQVQMGLFGVLIVRPRTEGQAYDDDDGRSAYDAEALLVLSEIDPALNAAVAAGQTYDLRQYAPRYTLINGRAFPQTDAIPAEAGERVLCRYVNAGTQPQVMTVLGAEQKVIAHDGYLLNYSQAGYSQMVAPGEVYDAIITVPSDAPPGAQIPLYARGRAMHTYASEVFPGGMMTMITVVDEPDEWEAAAPGQPPS